ncbi:MAG TPA: hypothetical protein VMT68_01155 [Caulobacteraceae bacterium]|nr:hypothetical protein [Caulobacteraceae bacterium]
MTSENAGFGPAPYGVVRARSADDAPEAVAEGVYRRRDFLPPASLLRVLDALGRLSASWRPSEALGLLGRGATGQVGAGALAVQTPLDEIRAILAPATLDWARRCGFWFPRPPQLQLFPVRMVGDAERPARQEPHMDSHPTHPGPPICTNVFYPKLRDVSGGDLAVQVAGSSGPARVRPAANDIVSFAGERVHWVEPLFAGERVSLVVNFY